MEKDDEKYDSENAADDVYSEDAQERFLENDEIESGEEAFMRGYESEDKKSETIDPYALDEIESEEDSDEDDDDDKEEIEDEFED